MHYSDNPIADFEAFDLDCERRLREFDLDTPYCEECGEPIRDNDYFKECGKFYCPDCYELYHRGSW